MGLKNIIDLNKLEFKSKNKKVLHYNINSSKITSEDLNAKKIFFDIKELQPGQFSYPYHYHLCNEEIFIILEGEVTLRQDDKTRVLKKGDLVFFSNSEKGSHQLFNHTNSEVRYLDLTTKFGIDVCKYPDSKKTNIGNNEIYRTKDKVDYYDGEEEIPIFWIK